MDIFFKFQTDIFISNFKNENFQIFPFQISFQFLWHISIFSFHSGGTAIFFSNFKNNIFLQNFLFQNSKKNQFKIQNQFFFKIFHFKFSLWHKRFFLCPRLPNLLKDCKNYLFTLFQNSHILNTIISFGGMVHRKPIEKLKKSREKCSMNIKEEVY
jgi:hypothetical protein